MMKLLIVAALAACCLAAPLSPSPTNNGDSVKSQDVLLQRPSPINPKVPSDPKPAERIVAITDPKEIAKHKRETSNVKPVAAVHHNVPEHSKDQHQRQPQPQKQQEQKQPSKQKREEAVKPSKPVTKPEPVGKAPSTTATPAKRHPAPPSTPSAPKHRQRRDEATQTQQHTAVPAPLIHRDEHHHGQEGHVAPQTLPAHLPAHDDETHSQGFVRPHPLPALLHDHDGAASSSAHKRDIPVPLVAKHPHPDESPKVEEKQKDVQKPQHEAQHIEVEDLSSKTPQTLHTAVPAVHHHDFQPQHSHEVHVEQNHETPSHDAAVHATASTTEHPVIRHHPVPVSELFARPKQQPAN